MPHAGFVIGIGAPLMPKCAYTLSVIKIKKTPVVVVVFFCFF